MILSNVEIVRCIDEGLFSIEPIDGMDPTKRPFNTSAVDLRLGNEITVPEKGAPAQLDLSHQGNIAKYWAAHSKNFTITKEQPYSLEHGQFILA